MISESGVVMLHTHGILLTLIQSSPLAIIATDLDGRVAIWNLAAERLFGWSAEEALGGPLLPVPRQERSRIIELHADGKSYAGRDVLRHRGDGSIIEVRIWTAPLRDAQGAFIGMVATAADMTESKRAEEALRESESHFRGIFEHSNDSILVIDPKHDKIVEANPQACRMLGFAREELLATPISGIHPHDEAKLLTFMETVFERRVGRTEALSCRTKTGDLLPVELSASVIEFDKKPHILLLARDLSESKRAEAALHERENQLRLITDSVPALIAYIGTDQRYQFANRAYASALGSSPSELFGKTVREVLGAAKYSKIRTYIDAALSGQVVQFEMALPPSNSDSERYGSVSYVPHVNSDGAIMGFYALIVDLTERKRAEAALRTSHEQLQVLSRRLIDIQEVERGRIARELHDEIGQALTAVKLNLQRIQGTSAKSSVSRSVSEGIAIVDSAVEEVRNLALDLRPSLLDDLGLVAALRWYTSRQAKRAGIEVTFSADSLAMRPSSDVETACFRVAQEAFTNVVRHAKARGVTVALRWRDEHLELTVGDDGIGFDADAARDWPSTDAHMGLVGMEERVLLIGGSFSIESTPGQGTLVRALFPLRPDRPAAGRPGDPVTRLKADY